MKNNIIVFFCLFVGLLFPQKPTQTIDGVAAIVENSILLKSDLVQMINMMAIQQRLDPKENPSAFFALQESVLQSMVDQKVVLEMAALDSIIVEEKEVNQSLDQQVQMLIAQSGSEEEAEKMLGQSLRSFRDEFWFDMQDRMISERYQQQLLNGVSTTRDDILGFYETYKDSLPILPLRAKIRQLLIKILPSDSSKVETIKLLNNIRKRIIEGESFASLAEQYSIDPSSSQGGSLGWVKRGSVVKKFETVAFTLEPGLISEPTETEFGFHLIETLDKKGEKINVRHILIAPEITKNDNKRAYDFALSLKDSSVSIDEFKNLITKHSNDLETRSLGGDLGWITPDNYPIEEIGLAIKYIELNQCSPPVNSPLGFHLLWLEEIQPGGPPNLNDHWLEIEAMALNKKKMNWYSNWLSNAREKFYIRIIKE